MSISIANERLLTLRDAANSLPPSKSGKHIHIATIHRWASRGLRGVRLETIRVGGRTCTSAEALQRFFERLSAQTSTGRSQSFTNASSRDGSAHDRAAAFLDEESI